jgi:cbb3-type cytochrome oxidase subunit 1
MNRIDLKFLLLGAMMLTAGVSLGVVMGIRHDFSLAPVHAHINLVGWASLSLFGIVYKLYPELARSRLAAWHFALSAPAAILFPIGIALSMLYEQPLVAILAALIWLAGAILFLIQLIALAHRPVFRPTLAAAE